MIAKRPESPGEVVSSSPATASLERGSDTHARASTLAAQRLGSVLVGRFDLVRVLGSGGFGDVYEARDREQSGASVALKVLRHASPQGIYRLKQEFRAHAQLAHPNLVGLHELFVEQGQAFFTMELVEGVDILSYVRPAGQVDAQRLRKALDGLVRGVNALHLRRSIHRDLKPSNVLVEPSGRVVIVDFGLALALDAAYDGHTEQGFLGTPAYAAPEQLTGAGLTTESDWYACGCMLYEALSGQLPFTGTAYELALSKTAGAFEPLGELPANLAALGDLCTRLLAPSPKARPSSVEILAALGNEPGAGDLPVRPHDLFVGRDPQLRALEESLRNVERGAAARVLVSGASGIGKTALVDAFIDRVASKHRSCVLRGRCYVSEEVPYRGFDGIVDALSHFLRGLPAVEAAALLPRDVRMVAQLFPVLERVDAVRGVPHPRAQERLSEQELRARAFRALRELLAAIGDRYPLVLFMDDVQWDDPDTAALLTGLLSPPAPPSLLLIATCRTEGVESSHVARALRDGARLGTELRELELSSLSPDEARALARRAHPAREIDDSQLAVIAHEGAGHPMFTLELSSRLAEDSARDGHATLSGASLSLDAMLRARVATLRPGVRRLLEVVCVAGHRLKRSTALATAASDADCLRELAARKLVSTVGVGRAANVEPYHDRVRESLVGMLDPQRLRETHLALAEQLASEPAPPVDLVVEHYLLAGEEAEAARHAVTAADQAASVLAFHRVPGLLQLGLRYAPPADRGVLEQRLGEAYALLGRAREASHAFRAAASHERDPDRRWELVRRAMWQALVGGYTEEGLSLVPELNRAAGLLSAQVPLLGWMVNLPLYLLWRAFGSPPLRERAGESAAVARSKKRMLLAWSLATGLAQSSTWLAAQFSITAGRLSARLGDAAHYAAVFATLEGGKGVFSGVPKPRYERGLEGARRIAERSGDPAMARFVDMSRVAYALCTAQFQKAYETLSTLLRFEGPSSETDAYVVPLLRLHAMPTWFWCGRLSEARREVERWLREAIEFDNKHLELGLHVLGAHRLLSAGQAQQAMDEWRAAKAAYPAHAVFWDPVWGVVIGLYASRLDFAREALTHARRTYLRWTLYVAPSRVLHHWARGAVWAAELVQGQDTWRTRLGLRWTIALLAVERAPLRRPFLAHMRAVAALHAGDGERARRELEHACALFEEHGMRLFAACAHRVLADWCTEAASKSAHAAAARAVFEAEELGAPDHWTNALLPGVLPCANQSAHSARECAG